MNRSFSKPTQILLGLVAAASLVAFGFVIGPHVNADADPVPFTDVKAQTMEFIGYEQSIQLTAEQEAVKRDALEALPAPCCSDNTAYTCCCPCNMSLSIWGLSNLLIAKHDFGVEQVRAKAKEWIEQINPDGFSGNVCYTGGCLRPFKHNGCGGMARGRVTWDGDA